MCWSKVFDMETEKAVQIQTSLTTSWKFPKKLSLALLCHQLGELFILAQLKICLPSVPSYSSAQLMAHV